MRNPEKLLADALAVIDRAAAMFYDGTVSFRALYSGGYDSEAACVVASHHPLFTGQVDHIDTGTGADETRVHVDTVCLEASWHLRVWVSSWTYRKLVLSSGFPGPGAHQWAYNWLKDKCLDRMVRQRGRGRKTLLITGCRSQESSRRMGHVDPIQVGELTKSGKLRAVNRVWVAPCHDWSRDEQRAFLEWYGSGVKNQIKESPLGMSGECFCGAFARPNEIEMIREYAPDVHRKIKELEVLANESGIRACKWGVRPPSSPQKGIIEVPPTGPMCQGCDLKCATIGVTVKPNPRTPRERAVERGKEITPRVYPARPADGILPNS